MKAVAAVEGPAEEEDVHSFGRNSRGQLGLGHSRRTAQALPTRIPLLSNLGREHRVTAVGLFVPVCPSDCPWRASTRAPDSPAAEEKRRPSPPSPPSRRALPAARPSLRQCARRTKPTNVLSRPFRS